MWYLLSDCLTLTDLTYSDRICIVSGRNESFIFNFCVPRDYDGLLHAAVPWRGAISARQTPGRHVQCAAAVRSALLR